MGCAREAKPGPRPLERALIVDDLQTRRAWIKGAATCSGWLWLVEKQTPTLRDVLGVVICLVGMAVIATGPRAAAAAEVSAPP